VIYASENQCLRFCFGRCQLRVQRSFSAVLFLAAVLFLFGNRLSAHHSQAGFETPEKAIPLKGTVVEFRWRNPHILIFWDVKDDSGKVVRWVGELGSISSASAGGLTKDSLKPGDEISLMAIPSRAGTPQSIISKLVKADGTVLVGRAAGANE
jgi:Family of unknown function (DUF6152)